MCRQPNIDDDDEGDDDYGDDDDYEGGYSDVNFLAKGGIPLIVFQILSNAVIKLKQSWPGGTKSSHLSEN